MADQPPTLSFQLPTGETIETYAVRLADGRIVTRTRQELEELPPALRGTIIRPLTPPSK